MTTNPHGQRPQRSLLTRAQLAFYCFVIIVGSDSALAQLQINALNQPQVNYEMTQGAAELIEAPAQLQYPTRASERGIVGWAEVRFDIDSSGQVIAYTVEVVDAQPRGIFDSATRRAVERFRFTPYAPDGIPIAVSDVRYRFQYSL